jgi:hypothetical protein
MLCIFGHCGVDTFLSLRLLSQPTTNLVSKNVTTTCEAVADSTFIGRPRMLQLALQSLHHDIKWLKDLRFKQLAAIVVERTNFSCNGHYRLRAESIDTDTESIEVGLLQAGKVLAQLSSIAQECAAWPDGKFPEKQHFEVLSIYHLAGVTQVRAD